LTRAAGYGKALAACSTMLRRLAAASRRVAAVDEEAAAARARGDGAAFTSLRAKHRLLSTLFCEREDRARSAIDALPAALHSMPHEVACALFGFWA
jgi:hypothetical protein